MINFIFKSKENFRNYPNELLPFNAEYVFRDSEYAFGNLSKTNIFIGENNSGKSRFLRSLFQNDFRYISNDGIDDLFNNLRGNLINSQVFKGETHLSKFDFLYNESKKGNSRYTNPLGTFFSCLEKVSYVSNQQNKYYFPTIRGTKDYKTILNRKLDVFLKANNSIQNKDPIHHYISLLNLEEGGLGGFDIYREITIHEYFSKRDLNILTGGTLYRKIKSMLLGKETERTLISEFQIFLRNNFFIEYDTVQLIPNEIEKVLYIKIGNAERPIYDWGDGTQQLIVILFSLFIHKDDENSLFFIEEPEIYLHPGILRKFIEVINSADVFPNHQYFITTHSNIVLDTSADSDIKMSIFKFTKNKNADIDSPHFIIEQCNNGDVSLLNVLGVRNSSVFLANCSIWVEGITDRLYLKHYLNLYFKKHGISNPYRENIDYTFIEYGGNNIVHFNFDKQDSEDSINAKYINNRIFLIADNDNTAKGSKKFERKKHLNSILGNHFYELPVTEIENLLSQKSIEQILKKQNPKHSAIIESKFAEPRKYKSKKLGRYIDDLFRNTDMKKYSGESGTIKNKLDFCQSAIELITDYDMLSDESKELVEKIVDFIKDNN